MTNWDAVSTQNGSLKKVGFLERERGKDSPPKQSLHLISIGTFFTIYDVEIESCKGYWYTPFYETKQKWERKTPMETTLVKVGS